MKHIYAFITIVFLILVVSSHDIYSQGVAINNSGSPADGSAMLDITSSSSGLLIPRMTLAQRNSISNPATGLMVYQTDNDPGFYYYTGSGWNRVGDGYGTVTSISTENGITGGPITSSGTIGLTGQALSLHNLNTNGFIYRNGATVGTRTISVSGNGIGILYGDGASGNPTISLNIGTGASQVAAGNHAHALLTRGAGLTGNNYNGSAATTWAVDFGNSTVAGNGPKAQGNFGQFQAHSTYTDFNDNPAYWGWNYVQGNTNAPNTISSQWYREVVSLGDAYPARGSGGYSMELAFPRNNAASAGVWMRTIENGTIGGWTRIDANGLSVSGSNNYVAKFTGANSVGNSQIYDNGTNVGIGNTGPAYKLDVSGDIRSTNKIYANANGASYFRGGDDAELWDINVSNTMGVYGVQNSTIASIKLGSGGGILSGYNGSIGINTTNPTATLHVNGDVVTGRLGTAGTYSSTEVQGIWSIGDGWRIDESGNNFGNQYGIVYAHTNAGTSTTKLPIAGWGHQVMFTDNGVRNISMSLSTGNAYFAGSLGIGTTSPYGKIHIQGGNLNLGSSNDPSVDQGNNWLTWGYRSDSNPYYCIRTNFKTYGSYTYSRLQLNWHTGIEIGASSTYGGTRFFNNSPGMGGTQIMSIGDGDNHVRVNNYLFAQYLNSTDNSVSSGVTGVVVKTGDDYHRTATAAAMATFLNSTGTWIPNNGSGDYQIASSSTSTSYSAASLELRERSFGGSSSYTAPRLSFHWGGVVASQIGIESSGRIAILNNPGTGYENLIANNIYAGGAYYCDGNTVIDDNGGWHRSYGNTGFYNGTHGGGIYMTDNVWLRVYNNKNFYTYSTQTDRNAIFGEKAYNVAGGSYYDPTSAVKGYYNNPSYGDSYRFGTYGKFYHTYSSLYYGWRCGGVLGSYSDAGGDRGWGALAYNNSGGTFYGGYFTSYTSGGGYMNSNADPVGIGSGSYGGIIGSWARGEIMGQVSCGEIIAEYNIGDSYTSGRQAEIIELNNERVAAYPMSSTDLMVYKTGKGKLVNGHALVQFDDQFVQMMSGSDIPNVTITPIGDCKGIHIVLLKNDGFEVAENQGGESTVEFTWIAIGKRKDSDTAGLPSDLGDKNFDKNMKEVMFNEANTDRSAKNIKWTGNRFTFESASK